MRGREHYYIDVCEVIAGESPHRYWAFPNLIFVKVRRRCFGKGLTEREALWDWLRRVRAVSMEQIFPDLRDNDSPFDPGKSCRCTSAEAYDDPRARPCRSAHQTVHHQIVHRGRFGTGERITQVCDVVGRHLSRKAAQIVPDRVLGSAGAHSMTSTWRWARFPWAPIAPAVCLIPRWLSSLSPK